MTTARAVRLPLELTEVPLDELERMGHEEFWLSHKLGVPDHFSPAMTSRSRWKIAREDREIPDLSEYPKIVAITNMIPAPRRQLWVSILEPGGVIRTHSDSERAGACRIHVPLVGAGSFEIEGRSISMHVGEFWAVDTVGRPHGAKNDGPENRVHLLVDVQPSPWLREHVPWL